MASIRIRHCFHRSPMTSQLSVPQLAHHIHVSRAFSTQPLSKLLHYNNSSSSSSPFPHKRLYTTSPTMSTPMTSQGHSADPYKDANEDNQVSLQTKVEDLTTFIKASKFCMMATHEQDTRHIVSRCMALAGLVSLLVSSIKIKSVSRNVGTRTC